jgi:hypothetical protein
MSPCFRLSGLNGATGAPLLPAMTAEQVVDWIVGANQQEETDAKKALRTLHEQKLGPKLGLAHGIDPLDLEQAGWGIVYAPGTPKAVRDALAGLVEHRKGRTIEYVTGESSRKLQTRHGQSPFAPLDPGKLPYYLLLAGGPEEIPFRVQYGLDALHAVGRLCFDAPEDYRRYAERVISHESATGPGLRERRVAFFAPRHPGDEPTANTCYELAGPLAQALDAKLLSLPGGEKVAYRCESLFGDDAVRPALIDLLTRSDHRPAVVFTAGHGLGFPNGHARQRESQGALVCREWPGPNAWPEDKPVEEAMLFGAGQVPGDADLDGLIVFTFACYGVGTPRVDDFSHLKNKPPAELAPQPFVARLPQRLLSRGALAFLGHIDRAWDYSFLSLAGGRETGTFQSTLEAILAGSPAGHAFEPFNERYLLLSRQIAEGQEDSLLNQYQLGEPVDPAELAHIWMAHNDARAYVLFGDPAVRLRPAAMPPA